MTFKEQALAYLNDLPDDCTEADLEYFLYVRKSIERGLKDVEAGRVLSHDEVKQRFARWLPE